MTDLNSRMQLNSVDRFRNFITELKTKLEIQEVDLATLYRQNVTNKILIILTIKKCNQL